MTWPLRRKSRSTSTAAKTWARSRGALFEPLESRNLLATLPYGAMPDDTGEFMLGDVYVTVVLLESNTTMSPHDASTENWTAGAISDVKAKIQEGVTWWSEALDRIDSVRDGLLNFEFDWTYADNPVQTGYEPISRISNDFSLWIYDFLGQTGFAETLSFSRDIRAFNNFQREQNDADWAFTIFVANDAVDGDDQFAEGGAFRKAFAYSGGQFMVVPASRPASTYAHETGHMFWAYDEYEFTGNSYNKHRGYYNTQNANAADNPGHDHANSIMSKDGYLNAAYAAYTSSPSSLEMIGWKDSDNDGIFDVLDVPFDLTGTGEYNAATGTYSFNGTSEVRTLVNKNPSGLGNDITINQVRRAEYKIDDGPWQAVQSWDNAYKVNLNLSFPVPAGDHEIRIRTLDTKTGVMSAEFIGTTSTPATQTIPSGTGGFLYNDSNNSGSWDQGEMPLVDWAIELVDLNGELIQLHNQVEPDALVGVINNQIQGMTLTAIGGDVQPPGDVLSEESELFPALGSVLYTNSWTLGRAVETWTESSRQLKIQFSDPQTVVNVKAVGAGGESFGRLEAYNAAGELLGRFTTRQLGGGQSQMMSIARLEGDIAYVIAGGHAGTEVILDVVAWGPKAVVTTDTKGAYVLPNLPAGSYKIVVLAPPSFLPTSPGGNELPIVLGGGQSAANQNMGFRFLGSAWRNTTNSRDVDADGYVTALDALIVINRLNTAQGSQLGAERPDGAKYYDVDADLHVTPLDALIIINHLNSASYNPGGSGEGELEAPEASSTYLAAAGISTPEGEELALAPAGTAAEYFSRQPFHVLDLASDDEPCMCGSCVGSAIESLVAEEAVSLTTASKGVSAALPLAFDPATVIDDALEPARLSTSLDGFIAARPNLRLLTARWSNLREVATTIEQRLAGSGIVDLVGAANSDQREKLLNQVDDIVPLELSKAWTRLRARLLQA